MWGTGLLDCLQPKRIPTQLYFPGNTLLNILKKGSLLVLMGVSQRCSGSILKHCSHGSCFVSVKIICWTWCEGHKSLEYSVLYCISLFSPSHGSRILPWHSNGWWLEHSCLKWGLPFQTQMAMETSFSTLCVSSIMSMLLKKRCVKVPLLDVVQNVCLISYCISNGTCAA